MHKTTTGLLALLLTLGCLTCASPDEPGSTTVAYFTMPREGTDFFTLPWPNDIRMDDDGTVNLRGFPASSPLVSVYLSVFEQELRGWGTNAAVFFRFSASLDASSLPATAAETLVPDATAYLVDVDPDSPDYATRVPVEVTYGVAALEYIGPNHLVLRPVAGFSLREATTYAALLGRGVRDHRGRSLRQDLDFTYVMRDTPVEDPALEAAWQAYAPLRAYLSDQGLEPSDVLNAAVFTTQSIVDTMVRLRDAVYRDMDAPPAVPADLRYTGGGPGYHVYEGTYEAPVYQHGEVPYSTTGGGFELDGSGDPVLARTEPMRFAISVPIGDMPAAGWPIVLYAHGTGGSYRTFINNDVARDLARIYVDGEVIARAAVIGVDQVLHGTRCEVAACNPELNFFNFQNPIAGRDNVRQGALDNVQLLRLVEAMHVDSGPDTGAPIHFDPERIYFFGHSQGGLTGPPFLAVEPKIKAAVLSGAGGNMILSLLSKTAPVNIPELMQLLLGEDEPLTASHPVLSLIQIFIEPADPLNYGRYFIHEPLVGVGSKHIYLSQGWFDHYTPPVLTEAFAVAAGLELVSPWLEPQPRLVLDGQLDGLERPVAGNLAGGSVTGVMLQYLAWGNADGHFVVYDNPNANQDYRHFLGTAIRDGIPTVGQ
jgi:predicted esterase